MKKFTLNCKGMPLPVEHPIVMGIINCTLDSFFDGGKYSNVDDVLRQAEKMLQDGATILDIGGMSTRLNAVFASEEQEIQNIAASIEKIHFHFPKAIISIDTFRSKVAETAIQLGASIINDISGGTEDDKIFDIAAKYHCPYILMHRRGTFDTMHQPTAYASFLSNIIDDFNLQLKKANAAGVHDIIIDPGFGFSKSIEQNFYLLKNLHILEQLGKPILAGLSRKSMLYKLLDITPVEALNATTAANMVALMHGAAILRVHDVKEAVECIKLYNQIA
jgi:dihydropteroate synthase